MPSIMPYRILADLVALTHLGFVLFVLFGGLLALRWDWIPWLHLPCALWGAAVELFGWFCPLTPLENWLRRAGGGQDYAGGFIEHYLMPLLYPVSLTRGGQLLLALIVVVINLGVYAYVWTARQG